MTTLETLKPALKQIFAHVAHHSLFPRLRVHKQAQILGVVNEGKEISKGLQHLGLEFETSTGLHAVTLYFDLDTEFRNQEIIAENGDQYLPFNIRFHTSASIGGTRSLREDLERAQIVLAITEFAVKLQDEFTGEFLGFWRTAEEAVEQERKYKVGSAEGELRGLVQRNKKNWRTGTSKEFPTPKNVFGFVDTFLVSNNERVFEAKVGESTTTITRIQ